jgi:hypothetical protein
MANSIDSQQLLTHDVIVYEKHLTAAFCQHGKQSVVCLSGIVIVEQIPRISIPYTDLDVLTIGHVLFAEMISPSITDVICQRYFFRHFVFHCVFPQKCEAKSELSSTQQELKIVKVSKSNNTFRRFRSDY